MNNLEYWWIKMMKFLGLDWKSQFRVKNYSFFKCYFCIGQKYVKKAQKWPKIIIILHYLTRGTNRLAWFNPICAPNPKSNVKFFRIFFFNHIIHPSLPCNHIEYQIQLFWKLFNFQLYLYFLARLLLNGYLLFCVFQHF